MGDARCLHRGQRQLSSGLGNFPEGIQSTKADLKQFVTIDLSSLVIAHFVAGLATDFSRAESLIATVYEALRANPALFERSVLLVTYDEHGGFYDHEPPPVDAPNPGTRRDAWTRLLHLLLRRRSAGFDFTMLGPRVPAVVISPYVPKRTLDETIHEHSSVPRTLRQVFAPDSAALTSRDAWAQPFHTLLSLVAPRRDDLPDLSAFVGPAAPQGMPTAAPDERAAEITQIFTAAAQRHRDEQQGTRARAEQIP
jgi:phospholipase C